MKSPEGNRASGLRPKSITTSIKLENSGCSVTPRRISSGNKDSNRPNSTWNSSSEIKEDDDIEDDDDNDDDKRKKNGGLLSNFVGITVKGEKGRDWNGGIWFWWGKWNCGFGEEEAGWCKANESIAFLALKFAFGCSLCFSKFRNLTANERFSFAYPLFFFLFIHFFFYVFLRFKLYIPSVPI